MHDQCPDCESYELETVATGSGAMSAFSSPEEDFYEDEIYQICRSCGWQS